MKESDGSQDNCTTPFFFHVCTWHLSHFADIMSTAWIECVGGKFGPNLQF